LADDLQSWMSGKQAAVETALRQQLSRAADAPPALVEAMAYSLLAPGKRLRPMLVLLASAACGGGDAAALPAACAVEMIHTYSLIHDDLPAMDDDDLRRGLPTCHKQFGEALAILAGDALLTLAFQVLAEGYPAATAAGCCRELARGAGAAGMVGGQVEDLAWENSWGTHSCVPADPAGKNAYPTTEAGKNAYPTIDALNRVHQLKTGALFRASLLLGLWAAQGERPGGPDPRLVAALEGYGRCFGLLFQVTDDLLDVEGDAAALGKQVQKDAARGKLTYPGLLGAAESRRRAQALCDEAQAFLRPLGAAADRLAALVRFILARDR
jgi:geranylgeranyl diphosphate synthase type II